MVRECRAGLSFRAKSRNRDRPDRGPLCQYPHDSSRAHSVGTRLPLARNDTYPAVLQFIRTIVVPTGRGATLGTQAREYGD